MKISISIAAILMCSLAFSQELPRDLKIAVKENPVMVQDSVVKLNPDLSYYSKNYNKVFGYDNYTFDALTYGERNVYVGDMNRWDFDKNTPHIFKVMPLPGVNVDACLAQPVVPGYSLKE